MTGTRTALRLTVFVGEADQWKHRPVYSEIVHRAHDFGLAGAAVFRGLEGYGALNRVHTSRILSLGEDLPVAIVIVDEPAKVRDFLPQLEGLVTAGLATVDEVEVVRSFGKRRSDVDPGTGTGGTEAGTGTGIDPAATEQGGS
ncbi:DUF190 domain-containing protein [Georgenia halophila]|uniref:DUF190 domain-containing protein n=1 Tax=Georgenia halophila TaxID=620889 RepID=A0ABP8LHD2_9MICO